ncbi:hypothetical protein BWQ93_05805 [Sphingopyxis sp. QXT-31]|uniref:hypothetical protein n=1 Tax=Sphingopyxis sp. QXT-31 TaxID=1357916 RepID=UPI000979796F|nr:hypothetical protein [Sphingopyxis sp. QXT-31]APZ98047.1 hypothetical protein BWQ93_05805 [Sphingopyxis sp. QXT-31]
MIHVAASNSPAEVAWAAFDAAAIRLNRMYAECAPDWDTPEERAARLSLSLEVVRLWNEFRALLVGDDTGPRPAA